MPQRLPICCLSLLLAGMLTGYVPASAENAEPVAGPGASSSILYLPDGDFYHGTLENVDQAGVVRWQSPSALVPFEFPAQAVRAIHFPPPAEKPVADGDFCVELSDGDMLFGSLVRLTSKELEIESPRFGRLLIDRRAVRRIARWGGAAAWEYIGPDGLAGWRQLPRDDCWREESGHLCTSEARSAVRREFAIPDKARIEFAVSWAEKPDFVLAFTGGETDEPARGGFRFEVWDGYLAIVRELDEEADLELVSILNVGQTDRVHLQALLEQKTGKISVHALDGTQLAEIQVAADNEAPLKWLSLSNKRGDLRLEQLTIGRWNGEPPLPVDVNKSRIETSDGAVEYGEIVEYRAEGRKLVVQQDAAENLVDIDRVSRVVLAPKVASTIGSLRVGFHDGSRIGGDLLKVADNRLHLSREGIAGELVFPVSDVRSLFGLGMDTDAEPISQKRIGRLKLEGMISHGTLSDWKEAAGGCMAWRPKFSATSSPMRSDVAGHIVYRERRRPIARSTARQEVPPRNGFLRVMLRATGIARRGQASRPRSSREHTLYLLGGDRLPCEVSHIDEQGVHFSSTVVETEFVPHAQIKALELESNFVARALEESKRQRLLTLPRMQKNNPPTHLFVSTTGDYLRGRLQEMSADALSVEARLDTQRLPRERVACIIWLHDEEPDADAATTHPTEENDGPSGPRIQAVRDDGVRLTFVPRESSGNMISGDSKLLGGCQVDVAAVDQLVLGNMIERVADEQTYHAWKLQDAVEPRFVRDAAGDGSDGAAAALASSLVGQPAPDFRLDRLDGGEFRLSEQKGHVVVLDFWASWCGWCIEAMPKVDSVVKEFSDQGVKLVTVNMAEDRATVVGALERLSLHPEVVLDVDGATAEKYEVTALPQTVVIDAEGSVFRLFVGSDPKMTGLLRQTLEQLVAKGEDSGSSSGKETETTTP